MTQERTHKQIMELKKQVFEAEFKLTYARFVVSNAHDDRILFVNEYETILEALAVVSPIENNFIQCAFNKQLNEYKEEMRGIQKRFEDK